MAKGEGLLSWDWTRTEGELTAKVVTKLLGAVIGRYDVSEEVDESRDA